MQRSVEGATGGAPPVAVYTVPSAADAAAGSLRAAAASADALTGAGEIRFELPRPGPYQIAVSAGAFTCRLG